MNQIFNIVAIYRPPSNSVNDMQSFLNSLEGLIKNQSAYCILIGDVNIDILKNNNNSLKYMSLLNSYNFNVVNTEVTHPSKTDLSSGSLIDHLVVNFVYKTSINTFQLKISDHYAMFCQFNLQLKINETNKMLLQKKTNYAEFKKNVENIILSNSSQISNFQDLSDLLKVNLIENTTEKLVEIKNIIRAPWANNFYVKLIDEKKKILKKNQKKPHNFILKNLLETIQQKINSLKSNLIEKYYNKIFDECKNEPKKIWAQINSILYNKINNKKSNIIKDIYK